MADRYWVNGGTGNWNSTTNWSATSGGPSGASVPSTSDDVFFDNLGNSNCTVNTAPTVLSVTVSSGYTSNISFTNSIITTVSLELGINLTTSGSATQGFRPRSGTIRCNGCTGVHFMYIDMLSTITLLDILIVNNLTIEGNQATNTINGFSISISGNLTINAAAVRVLTGTTILNINGTGNQTYSNPTNTMVMSMTLNINKPSGTLTITNIVVGTCTFTHITGTVSHTGTLSFYGGSSPTLNTSGMSWNNITVGIGSQLGNTTTLTLTSTLNLLGNLTLAGLNNSTVFTIVGAGLFTSVGGTVIWSTGGGFTFNPANDMTVGNITISTAGNLNTFTLFNQGNLTNTNGIGGSGTIRMSGTGTWSGNGGVRCNLIFDTAGTITVSGTVVYGTQNSTAGNLTYTSGTIISSSGTLSIIGGTWDTSGMIWSNLFCNSNNTFINLVSDINCVNLQINNVTFTPSGGNNINISGDLNLSNQSTVGLQSSTTNYRMVGTGTISANHTTARIAAPLVFNTLGTITLSGTIGYSNSTFTYTSGTIVAKGSTFIFNSGVTVLGASRMNLDNVQIAGGGTITMNEFFSGTPQIPTKVVSTTTANYTINFTDGFEKLAKNVRVSRCTIANRGQLLLLSKGGFGVNNLGIRYYNQSPNGVATDTQKFVNNNLAGMPALRAVNMLVGDPVFT